MGWSAVKMCFGTAENSEKHIHQSIETSRLPRAYMQALYIRQAIIFATYTIAFVAAVHRNGGQFALLATLHLSTTAASGGVHVCLWIDFAVRVLVLRQQSVRRRWLRQTRCVWSGPRPPSEGH